MSYHDELVKDGVDPMTAQKFIFYHCSNPGVWKNFESKALALIDKGVKHFGAKAIFETIRYEATLEKGADGFKANNSYAAYYARIFAIKHKINDFFETREVKGLTND